MKLVEFFKKIGSVTKRLLGLAEALIPDEQMLAGVAFVEAAADRFAEHQAAEKKEWVQGKLQHRYPGMSETIANVVIHLALLGLKKGIHKVADEAEKQIEESGPSAKQ